MAGLIVWKDEAMDKLRKDFDRLLDRCWSRYGLEAFHEDLEERPGIYLFEKDNEVLVRAEIPGLTSGDFELYATSDTLRIHVETHDRTMVRQEVFSGLKEKSCSISRTVRLPCKVEVDEITATYREGVLEVFMPKKHEKGGRYVIVRNAGNG